MFELTLIDHLRLTFGHVVYRHKTHSQLAHERARRSRWLKAIEAALMAGVVGTATAAAFGKGPIYTTLAAVLAAIAVAALLVDLTLDFGRSARCMRGVRTALADPRGVPCAPCRFGGWRARHRGRASPPRCLDARAARDLRERAARRCASLPGRCPGDRHGGRSRPLRRGNRNVHQKIFEGREL